MPEDQPRVLSSRVRSFSFASDAALSFDHQHTAKACNPHLCNHLPAAYTSKNVTANRLLPTTPTKKLNTTVQPPQHASHHLSIQHSRARTCNHRPSSCLTRPFHPLCGCDNQFPLTGKPRESRIYCQLHVEDCDVACTTKTKQPEKHQQNKKNK